MLLKLGARSLKSIASVLEKRANKIQKKKLEFLPVKARVLKSHGSGAAPVATTGPTPPAPLTRSKTAAQLAAADPSKWVFKSVTFKGAARFITKGKEDLIQGEIEEGLRTFEQNPAKYLAIKYQTNMTSFPKEQQKYWLLHRAGTKGYQPADVGPDGWMTFKTAEYQRLKPLPVEKMASAKDDFTDGMQFAGMALHHDQNPPFSPGRGMGVGDVPSLKIIGDVDPSDGERAGCPCTRSTHLHSPLEAAHMQSCTTATRKPPTCKVAPGDPSKNLSTPRPILPLPFPVAAAQSTRAAWAIAGYSRPSRRSPSSTAPLSASFARLPTCAGDRDPAHPPACPLLLPPAFALLVPCLSPACPLLALRVPLAVA